LPLVIWTALVTFCSAPGFASTSRCYLPVSTIAALTAFGTASAESCDRRPSAHRGGPLVSRNPLVSVWDWPSYDSGVQAFRHDDDVYCSHRCIHRDPCSIPSPSSDPHILAVNTHFGGQSPHGDIDSRLEFEERSIQQIALAHPARLLVFPESIIPSWNGMHEASLGFCLRAA